MAEGLCRLLKSDDIEPFSAGLETHGLNPLAIKVLSEIDIDITTHKSQLLEEFSDINFDFVVTVCSHAHETCPVFPGNAIVIHKGFDDPPKLAKNATTEEEALAHYRRVRDEIKDFVITLPQALHY